MKAATRVTKKDAAPASTGDATASHSLILSAATRVLMPLLMMLSVFLLLRGHNEPGGGFVGGLVASTSFVLFTIAHGVRAARAVIRVDPGSIAAVGIAIAALSGLPAVLAGEPYMTGMWLADPLPVIGKAGTPLLFDAGVYCVVLGVVVGMVFTLTEH
ncbi:MAG: Na+/H+ antiporter MnhB subunit-related protein [Bacteroidetes bacterium]|nr:Na+/H+ antiporter MnhB subunit-related protein [Bacteroidota bacterium]